MKMRLGMLGAPHVDAFVLRSWRRRCNAKTSCESRVAASSVRTLFRSFVGIGALTA